MRTTPPTPRTRKPSWPPSKQRDGERSRPLPAFRRGDRHVRHQCAAEFGLTGRWGFQYANTCSRPRVDAFGGGAHMLDLATGETVAWTYTEGWLHQVLDGGDPDA